MPTVRMTWYCNTSDVWLSFTPFAYIQDENGNASKDRKYYEAWSGTIEYQEYLDAPLSITGEGPDYEKSRRTTSGGDAPQGPLDFSFPPDDVYCEVEYITE